MRSCLLGTPSPPKPLHRIWQLRRPIVEYLIVWRMLIWMLCRGRWKWVVMGMVMVVNLMVVVLQLEVMVEVVVMRVNVVEVVVCC